MRRSRLAAAAWLPLVSLLAAGADTANPPRRPNVVLILADDLGYEDLGVQGGVDVRTPRIDAFARDGVRLTDGYVASPVCAPSRAALMTGRYPHRFGFEDNSALEDDGGLPLSERTLAERLGEAGYATGMVGKWHLGAGPTQRPIRRGFGEFFGILEGQHAYLAAGPEDRILRGDEEVEEKEYLTDAFAREAVAFIGRHRREPFFLYLAFTAPHAPLQAPEADLERFVHIADPRRRTYAAMVFALDRAVGRVLDALRENGLEKETLVLFLNDNGGPTDVTTARNTPLRGKKGELFEGGIRVPFLLRWPGAVPKGVAYHEPVSSLDVAPSVLAAVGLPSAPEIDGVDLLPYLTGARSGPPHTLLFWRSSGRREAVRAGPWKLVITAGDAKLFDLSRDLSEARDLAAAKPERVRELRDALAEWESRMPAPVPRATPAPSRGL